MTRDDSRSTAVAISFGGTKVLVALVDPQARRIALASDRIEWHGLVSPTRTVTRLVADIAYQLMQSAGVKLEDVDAVGVAWPGPGRYADGEVQATFIPGFTSPTALFPKLRDEFVRAWGRAPQCRWQCSLDAAARARGELAVPGGAWADDHRATLGLVLNLATGIAGAIVRDRMLVTDVPGLGETYGQWGRFLLRDRRNGEWHWKPTTDGSIPAFDPDVQMRFTEVCGGPRLAQRFAASRVAGGASDDCGELFRLSSRLVASGSRDVGTEHQLLQALTGSVRADRQALAFVKEFGSSVGSAVQCLANALLLDLADAFVVLTGGVGENFGAAENGTNDVVLESAKAASGSRHVRFMRSRLGVTAELIGAVL